MFVRKIATGLAAGALLTTGLAASAEAATPSVRLTKVYVNAPGSDSSSNSSVNGEYVVIKNTGKKAVSLSRWTLRDETRHVYTFGSFTLGAGKSVTVFSGRGTNSAAKRYWGSTWHIWNNSGGDSATLRTASGTKVDSCAWKTVSAAVTC